MSNKIDSIGHHEVRLNLSRLAEDGTPMRECPRCREEKPLNGFGLRNMVGKDGQPIIANQSYCRGCR